MLVVLYFFTDFDQAKHLGPSLVQVGFELGFECTYSLFVLWHFLQLVAFHESGLPGCFAAER